jgi:hypothetical protein
MRRSICCLIWCGTLLGAVLGGWNPSALATEPLPTPASTRSLQSLFPIPPPVLVEQPAVPVYLEQPGAPAPIGGGAADGPECNCPQCCGPSVRIHGPISRWYHCRAKPALQASHWGYPELFQPRPFGSYVRTAGVAQIGNGLAAQLVLYHYDFVRPDGLPGVELNLRGRVRLEKLAELAATGFAPLVIELHETDPELNAARKAHVLAQLAQLGPGLPEDQVVVGRPAARGLAGADAAAIYANVQTQL